MNYKLYKEVNSKYTALQQILYNRGIPIEKQEAWLSAGPESLYSWRLLEEEKMIAAVKTLRQAIENKKKIALIVDADADGYTSSAILLNYLNTMEPNAKIDYFFHEGKQHGFHDLIDQLVEYDLVISPDGGNCIAS